MSRFFIALLGEDDENPADAYHSFFSSKLNAKALHRSLVNLERASDVLFIEDSDTGQYKAFETGRAPKISVGSRKRFIKEVLAKW